MVDRDTREQFDPEVLANFEKYTSDPFRGGSKRHVLPVSEEPSSLEVEAGRRALTEAGLEPGDIDLLVVYSQRPDWLAPRNHALVAHRLGIPPSTYTIDAGADTTTRRRYADFLGWLADSEDLGEMTPEAAAAIVHEMPSAEQADLVGDLPQREADVCIVQVVGRANGDIIDGNVRPPKLVEVPIEPVPEGLTTREAESRLREAGLDPRKRRRRLDALAAQIILQEVLDRRRPQDGA